MARYGEEDALQVETARLLDRLGVLWHHTPNGGLRTKSAAGRLKAQGVKPGVPDVLVYEPRAQSCGLAVELKSRSGRVSPEQRGWLAALEARGWRVAVCRSLSEVEHVCTEYLATPGPL